MRLTPVEPYAESLSGCATTPRPDVNTGRWAPGAFSKM